MIRIPVKNMSVALNDFLYIFCKATFIEIDDTRFMSILCKDRVDECIEQLMHSPLCEDLYNMLQVFGEKDFITFLIPLVKAMDEDKEQSTLTLFDLCEKHLNNSKENL